MTQSSQKSVLLDQILLHIIILVWGFTGILGKEINEVAEHIVWYRMLIAFVTLFVYLLFQKNKTGMLFGWKRSLLTGLVVAMHWLFFFKALKVSNVSITLATLSSATLFTSILEPILFNKKPIVYEILFGIVVIFGLVLIFQFEYEHRLGIIYALISAFCASLFTTINGKLVKQGIKASSITLFEMLGGLIIMTVVMLFTPDISLPDFDISNIDWIYLLILGIICTALAFLGSVKVMRNLSPYTVSISINMEPIYGILLALFFYGDKEFMSTGFYFGAGLIMATILANAYLKKKFNKVLD